MACTVVKEISTRKPYSKSCWCYRARGDFPSLETYLNKPCLAPSFFNNVRCSNKIVAFKIQAVFKRNCSFERILHSVDKSHESQCKIEKRKKFGHISVDDLSKAFIMTILLDDYNLARRSLKIITFCENVSLLTHTTMS